LIRRRRRRPYCSANTGIELEEVTVALKHGAAVQPDGMLSRKEAANLLGMNDTEFALRLIWDSAFPKPVEGAFRADQIRAWQKRQRGGATN
jgi:predicted DNA-binding transcriptional regulator AlpA